ncbi:hypothetical protein SMMN14_07915 [Sphaerulina musiva]
MDDATFNRVKAENASKVRELLEKQTAIIKGNENLIVEFTRETLKEATSLYKNEPDRETFMRESLMGFWLSLGLGE